MQAASAVVIHGYCCGESIEEISTLVEMLNAEIEFTLPKYLNWNCLVQKSSMEEILE